MIIDGSYLAIMPPVILAGDDIIASDVVVPGAVTTIGPNSTVNPILVQSQNLKAGFDALQKVEESITESAADSANPANDIAPDGTAYQIYKAESNAKVLMGPFLHMVARYVKQMGRLRIGDIKQYMTLPELSAIEGSANQDLVYKTFVLPSGKTRQKSKKVQFTTDLPMDSIDTDKHLTLSFGVKDKETKKQTLALVNPVLFRQLNYMTMVTPDVVSPMSEELERAFALELWDKAIQDPTHGFNQEEMNKMILEHYPMTRKHPEKYLQAPQQPGMPQPGQPSAPQPGQMNQPNQPTPPTQMRPGLANPATRLSPAPQQLTH